MKKAYSICMMFLLLCLSLGGCSESEETARRRTRAEMEAQQVKDSLALKVGVMQRVDCLPAFVAQNEGLFDSLGVDVRLFHYTSMLDYDKALDKGNLEGVFSDKKHVEYINKAFGMDMRQVKEFDTPWLLVANRKSRLRRLNQYSDKMVAMSRCSVTDYLCDRMIDSVKLSAERVFRIQINDVDLRLKMLINNEIDGAWLPEPQASVAVAHGNNVLMRSDARGEKFAVLVFTGKAFGDARRREQIKLFQKAYDMASDKIARGGEKYRRSLVKHYFKYNLK